MTRTRWTRNCEGVTRRDVLRVGVLSVLGLSLPDLLRMQAAQAALGKPARETSCILIYQSGGPSHLETFDLKPEAPADLRGEFKPIKMKVPGSDPASPSFSVRDLRAAPGIAAFRAEERRKLRAALDQRGRERLEKGNPRVAAMDTFYQKAHGLITSEAALRAFDINKEPDQVRERYGRHSFGQSALMARRLIEAGCRFVSIDHGGWDNHTTIFTTMKNDLLPQIDSGLSSLLQDLSDRGLLESTLVVMFGEFGRTPKVNKDAGRDHWPNSIPVAIAGGGIRNGIVVGATDPHGENPSERP